MHNCFLNKTEDDILPRLAPTASRSEKILRWTRMKCTISKRHHLTRKYYPSFASRSKEKYNVVMCKGLFVIHPFSIVALGMQIVVGIVWCLNHFLREAYMTFFDHNNDMETVMAVYFVGTSSILFLYILLNFFTGYLNERTRKVVLDPKKITRRYACTFFIFDLIDAIPVPYITGPYDATQQSHMSAVKWVCLLASVVRFGTLTEYIKTAMHTLSVPLRYHRLIICAFWIVLCLHWCTCFVRISPSYLKDPENSLNYSYMVKASFYNKTTSASYIWMLHKTLNHLICGTRGYYSMSLRSELLLYIVILVIAFFMRVQLMVTLLSTMQNLRLSSHKYESFFVRLDDYIKSQKVSSNLRYRILLYYKNKFQKRFFKEEQILNNLSEHLRVEIFLWSCAGFINRSDFFSNLSSPVIGHIVSTLVRSTYLSGDVVFKQDDAAGDIWFISYGTVALYTTNGLELVHAEDGDMLGVECIKMKTFKLNAVAVETTELFMWPSDVITKICAIYPQVKDKVEKCMLAERDWLSRAGYRDTKESILQQLNNDKILERPPPYKNERAKFRL